MPVSSKEFLDIKATTECRFTLKCVCDTISTPHSQMHHADKYSTAQSFGQFGQMVECSFANQVVVDLNPVAVT